MSASDEVSNWAIHIDDFDEGVINGWGLDRLRPNVAISVELVSSGGERLVVSANAFRQDLLDAGFGNGRHGFSVDVNHWDLGGNTISVTPVGGSDPMPVALISTALAASLTGKSWSDDYLKMLDDLAAPFLTAKDA